MSARKKTSGLNKTLVLEDERQREKRYKKRLKDRAKKIAEYEGPANAKIVARGLPPRRVYGDTFVGRVALVRPDDDLLNGGTDFYIGETYAVVDGINVFGWTSPIACTFFGGSDHHELCTDVAAVRAFRHNGEIVDFVDERLRADGPADPFGQTQKLNIPAPAVVPKLPTPKPPKPPVRDGASPDAQQPGEKSEGAGEELPPVRAEELLREQMLAPRAKSLGAVLSTLQPDQYELVAVPAMDSMIIEGQPGTGKTIVASHRAAYLINEDTPAEYTLDGKVLVVGPTVGYSNHVRQVINRLTGDSGRATVLSLPELADVIIGEKGPAQTGPYREYPHFPWQLAKVVRSTIARTRAVNDEIPRPAQAFEYLRTSPVATALHPELAPYLRQLPSYQEALGSRALAPLIAFIHWEIEKPESLKFVEHVIVDEAQDVTPLEWLLLDEINEADAWTILGDLNQRRSDHTLGSWREVLDVIAIDRATPVHKMRRGYRSTRPILEYANQLLPRDQRPVYAFQDNGPNPTVRKVRASDLGDAAVLELERLIAAYPAGTVAAICQIPQAITKSLRIKGWVNDGHNRSLWTRGGKEVSIFLPDGARGLEFDAVVVVEPAEFPTRYGRLGTLYTALTRANRELSVVHATPLPRSLKAPVNRG